MDYDGINLYQDTSFGRESGGRPPSPTSSNGSLSPTTSEISDFEDVGEDNSSSAEHGSSSRNALRAFGDSGASHKSAHNAGDDRQSILPSPGRMGPTGRSDGGDFEQSFTGRDASVKPPTPASTTKKHELFYFRDEMVFFLVEDTLFKVHSFFFERDSEYFRTMFRLHDTSSESRPIALDVSIASFESFLGVLYPVHFAQHVATTSNEWVAILALATKWSFATIRTLAMRELFPLASPIDKIVVGIRYDIKEWLNDAYVAMCERPEALTKQEGERLGLAEAIKISKMRQDARIGYKLLARCDLVAMVNESYCEVTNGRDIPDIVKGGSNASPPEVRVPEGSAIRGSSAEPSYTIPLDSNSLVTPNTALNANPPFSAESPPELSSNADPPIPAPSSTLESESFQRFYADCSKFSAEKPPIADYSLERKRQFVATMLLEWERLRVNAEVFNPDQTVQAELTSVKDSLEMFERRLAGPQKILSSVLRLLYARLVSLGQEIIRVQRERTGCTEANV